VVATVIALAIVRGLLELHDPHAPFSEFPLTLIGLFLVVLATGAAVLGIARIVLLTLSIRRHEALRWRTNEPSE
jgi:hypothetical protein